MLCYLRFGLLITCADEFCLFIGNLSCLLWDIGV